MKKLCLLLLLAAMLFSLAACGEESTNPSEESSGGWDKSVDHKVIMDDSGTKILIADLDMGDGPEDIDIGKCIVWEWDSETAEGSKLQGKKITMDEAGYRYSACWKRPVVIFCGSGGWVGAVDYMTKEVLFEDNPGNGPHSVELLPNGDLVVACSGNSNSSAGKLLYYPLSKGEDKPSSSLPLVSAHGVCWDPANEVIWALGGSEIIACVAEDGVLKQISDMGVSLSEQGYSGGHDLVPAYGQPGKYWVSCSSSLLFFDSEAQTLTNAASMPAKYLGASVKGIAWFSDGTMILTAHNQGGTGDYRSSEFRILYPDGTDEDGNPQIKVVTVPHRKGSETYKIHTFSDAYQ